MPHQPVFDCFVWQFETGTQPREAAYATMTRSVAGTTSKKPLQPTGPTPASTTTVGPAPSRRRAKRHAGIWRSSLPKVRWCRPFLRRSEGAPCARAAKSCASINSTPPRPDSSRWPTRARWSDCDQTVACCNGTGPAWIFQRKTTYSSKSSQEIQAGAASPKTIGCGAGRP